MTDLSTTDPVLADRPAHGSNGSDDTSGDGSNRLALAEANIRFVRQGIALLESIDDGAYTRTAPPIYNSGVGAHVRHVLDHYLRFLSDYPTGIVDYDARARDPRIETDRRAALGAAHAVIEALTALPDTDLRRAVTVAMDCDAGGADDASAPPDPGAPSGRPDVGDGCPSTVQRELIFLVSHTVHHYALIGQMLRHQAVELPADFGVAPSTLRHQRRLAVARA